MKSRWERNPYVKAAHVHAWKITKKTPAVTGGWTWGWLGQQEHQDPAPMRLVRECADCRKKQTADVPNPDVLVPGYEQISDDVEWKETV